MHAHFGLTAWPALAVRARVRALTVHGNDLSHPRTRMLTARALPRMDLLAAASARPAQRLPRRHTSARRCCPAAWTSTAFTRSRARRRAAQLKLDRDEPFVLFPAVPSRAEKRYDLALALARDADVEVRALGDVAPELVATVGQRRPTP